MRYDVEVGGRRRQVLVTRAGGRYEVELDGRRWSVDAARIATGTLSLLLSGAEGVAAGGASREVHLTPQPGSGRLTAYVDGLAVDLETGNRSRRGGAHAAHGAGPQRLTAPMPGKVVRVLVAPGEPVAARQPVVVIEAMKMENELRAARDGRVSDVAVRDGQSVEAGALLAVIVDS